MLMRRGMIGMGSKRGRAAHPPSSLLRIKVSIEFGIRGIFLPRKPSVVYGQDAARAALQSNLFPSFPRILKYLFFD